MQSHTNAIPGNAIDRPSQLHLAMSRTNLVPLETGEVLLATGGLYAPTIRFHGGTFYIVCTNLVHVDPPRTENFIISTTDIWKGRWSDPVYFDFDGIDPSLLFDRGKVYVQGSRGPGPKTRIQQFEVDIATGKKLSDERTIWLGTGGDWAEGPHVYHRDEWYYLVISEGGTHEGHMVTAARSRDVWGPYEACPDNPILTAKGTGEYVQHTGHCDMFEDGEGNWWGVCLAARKDGEGRYVMGRESFLTRGSWDGGWPSLDRVTLSPEGIAQSGGPALSAVPGVDLVYIRDPELSRYNLSEDFSSATLVSSTADLPHPEDSPTFLGKRQRRLDGTSTVTIRDPGGPSWSDAGMRTGIACYKDEHRYLRIYLDAAAGQVVYELVNKAKEISKRGGADVKVEQGTAVSFRLEYMEAGYKLEYRVGGGEFACLGEVDSLDLTGPDFVGPIIGAFAVSGTEGCLVECSELSVE